MAQQNFMGPGFSGQTGSTSGGFGQGSMGSGGSWSQYLIPGASAYNQNLMGQIGAGYGGLQGLAGAGWQALATGYNPAAGAATLGADQQALQRARAGAIGGTGNNLLFPNAGAQNRYTQALIAYQQALGQQGQQAALGSFGGPGGILGGYQGLFNNAMGLTDQFGATQSQQIANAYQQSLAQQTQGLIDRGLYNSTDLNSIQGGLLQNEQLALTNLGQQVNQQKLGVLSGFGFPYMQAATSLGEQALQSQLGLGQAALGAKQQLGTNYLDAILAREGMQRNGYQQSQFAQGYNTGSSLGSYYGAGPGGSQRWGAGPDQMYQGTPASRAISAGLGYGNAPSAGSWQQGIYGGTVSYNPAGAAAVGVASPDQAAPDLTGGSTDTSSTGGWNPYESLFDVGSY